MAFGTRLVGANDYVVSPESGTSTEQMPVRRNTCRKRDEPVLARRK